MTKSEIIQMVASHGESLMKEVKADRFTVLVLKKNELEAAIKAGTYSECLYTLEFKSEAQVIRNCSDLDYVLTSRPCMRYKYGSKFIEPILKEIINSKYSTPALFELGFVYDGSRTYKHIKSDGVDIYIHIHSHSEVMLEMANKRHTVEKFINIESLKELETFISIME